SSPPIIGGGWFGYLGYRLGGRVESLDPTAPPAHTLPEFALAFYDHLVRLDRDGRWWFEALLTPDREPRIRARLAELHRLDPAAPADTASAAAPTALRPRPFTTTEWHATPSPAGHARAVAACRERIRAGDLFQANICLRLAARIEGDPLDLFATSQPALAPDRAAYLAGPWGALASLSPELFLERRGSRVRSAPIKGTRPRPADPDEAERNRHELAHSEKDLAENRMILDLARNDLGRVCDYGSIEVAAEARPRAHAGVWHLVSELAGSLHPSRGDRDLLRATFPPASVTGAPKIAAENAIAELESSARQAYTGAIGYASPLAGLELSVTIRTFEFSGGAAWLGLGGGIVADSDPVAEAAECRTKAAPLIEAIGGSFAPDPPAPAADSASPPAESAHADSWGVPRPLRLGPRPVPRPDAAAGVFETIRLDRGRALLLDEHLARAAASVGELYDAELPADLRDRIETAAADAIAHTRAAAASDPGSASGAGTAAAARMRVDLIPVAGGLRAELHTAPLDLRGNGAATVPTELALVTVPGGLGAHKWRDRRLIDRLTEAVAPALPLFCDLDGYLLEAANASILVQFENGPSATSPHPDGALATEPHTDILLATPPLDGRILPGITRAELIAEGRAVERPIHVTELASAAAVYTANALEVVARTSRRSGEREPSDARGKG
ncbi:MAG TPA: aminodeoxychorismate synthase component I, partial [Solirubrobacterales bacterium]|nr:aminodeoxychorismate synthase component I [Solirubrobacterales bacterium]